MPEHNFNIQGLNDEQALEARKQYGYNWLGDFPPKEEWILS